MKIHEAIPHGLEEQVKFVGTIRLLQGYTIIDIVDLPDKHPGKSIYAEDPARGWAFTYLYKSMLEENRRIIHAITKESECE